MAFGFGPQEMLDRAQVPDKWQLTPLRNFKSPRIRARMWRTALAVLITAVVYEYLLSKRNPCFALIGAVYAVGSQFMNCIPVSPLGSLIGYGLFPVCVL